MQGKVIIVAGAKGHGKSSIIKKLLATVNRYQRMVYDVQNEYAPDLVDPVEELPEFIDFIEQSNKVRNMVIVYEEATAFLSGKVGFKMRKLLVSSRHKFNTIVLVFHSVSMIPKDVMLLGNYLILFKTFDNPEDALKRFNNRKIYEAVKQSNKLEKYEHITVEYL